MKDSTRQEYLRNLDIIARPNHLRKVISQMVLLFLVLSSILLSLVVFYWDKEWTGIGKQNYTETTRTRTNYYGVTETITEKVEPAKTFWDILELLIIPAIVAVFAWWLNRVNQQNEHSRADRESQIEREIASERNQEAALQNYLDKMTELLLHEKLRTSQPEDEVSIVARTRTLTVLRSLNGERKGDVIRFLTGSKLVSGRYRGEEITLPIISLSEADLREAHLEGIDLHEADLTKANLEGAYLEGAYLWMANLERANLSRSDLNGANLEQTTLKKANLQRARLSKVDLRGADLEEADLEEAILEGAILEETDLRRVNLIGADMKSAYLTDADLKGAIMPDSSTWNERLDTIIRFTHPKSDHGIDS